MGEVKSAFEKAMEKIGQIEGLTKEEKEELKDHETLKTLLAAFYKGSLTRDGIWEKFRGMKPSLLSEAQMNMVDSLRPGSMREEFDSRKNGILAIEALKEKKNMAAIESALNAIEKLQREYDDMKRSAVEQLRAAIEGNPQMRLRQARTPDGKAVLQQLSVEEAMQSRLGEFLEEHDKRYEAAFGQTIAKLKKELK